MYRPIAPHIFIYKPQISSIFSVLHRTTGIILTLALLFFIFLAKWLNVHITHYPIYMLACFFNTYGAWLTSTVCLIWIFSFCWHFNSGIRHLIWDFAPNKFLKKKYIDKSALLIVFLALIAFCIVLGYLS